MKIRGQVAPIEVVNDNIKCPHCGKDTTLPNMLHMVIYEPIKCPHCNKIVIEPNTVIC